MQGPLLDSDHNRCIRTDKGTAVQITIQRNLRILETPHFNHAFFVFVHVFVDDSVIVSQTFTIIHLHDGDIIFFNLERY